MLSYFPLVALAAIGLLLGRPALAQQPASPPKMVYTTVEQPPQLPGKGGLPAILAAVQQQLVWPRAAAPAAMSGRVFVNVTVAPDGTINDARVVRGLRPDYDSAAVAAVRRLPRLSPAQSNKRAVYYGFTLPVSFQPAASPK